MGYFTYDHNNKTRYIVTSGNGQLSSSVSNIAEAKAQAERYGQLGYGKGTWEQVTRETAKGKHSDFVTGHD